MKKNTINLSSRDINKKKQNTYQSLSALEEDILSSIHGSERYGLEIVETIEKASNGKRKIGIGSLYPTLRRLEQKGLVLSRWDTNEGGRIVKKEKGAKRRYYKITPKGSSLLVECREFRDKLINFGFSCP